MRTPAKPSRLKIASGVLEAGRSVVESARKYSSSTPKRNDASGGGAAVRPGCRRLELMSLKPLLDHGDLPELGMPFGRERAFRIREETVHIGAVEQFALARARAR